MRTDEDKTQVRAFVRFLAGERDWLAAFVYIGESAVLATSNAAPGDGGAFSAGEQIVASRGPLVAKRKLFGRK